MEVHWGAQPSSTSRRASVTTISTVAHPSSLDARTTSSTELEADEATILHYAEPASYFEVEISNVQPARKTKQWLPLDTASQVTGFCAGSTFGLTFASRTEPDRRFEAECVVLRVCAPADLLRTIDPLPAPPIPVVVAAGTARSGAPFFHPAVSFPPFPCGFVCSQSPVYRIPNACLPLPTSYLWKVINGVYSPVPAWTPDSHVRVNTDSASPAGYTSDGLPFY